MGSLLAIRVLVGSRLRWRWRRRNARAGVATTGHDRPELSTRGGRSARLNQLPPWGLLLYYAAFLGLATMAGTVGRLAAGAAVGKLRTEARAWGYSLLLAGVLCVLGLVLRAKVEPIGLFQLELTNLRGILVTGVVAGLMPEVIRGRLQTLLPGRQAAGRSATARGRTSVRRTEGRVSPHRRKTGADDGGRRGPQQHPPLVESPGFAG